MQRGKYTGIIWIITLVCGPYCCSTMIFVTVSLLLYMTVVKANIGAKMIVFSWSYFLLYCFSSSDGCTYSEIIWIITMACGPYFFFIMIFVTAGFHCSTWVVKASTGEKWSCFQDLIFCFRLFLRAARGVQSPKPFMNHDLWFRTIFLLYHDFCDR